MANTIVNTNIYRRDVQESLHKDLVAEAVCNMEKIDGGNAIKKARINDFSSESFTPGTDLSVRDITVREDTITADQTRGLNLRISTIEQAGTAFDYTSEVVSAVSTDFNEWIDGYMFSQYDQAVDTLDDGDLGGTAGSAIDSTSSNIYQIGTRARQKVKNNRGKADSLCLVLSPTVIADLTVAQVLRDTQMGDNAMRNGLIGYLGGMMVYESNNLTATAVWTPVNNPSNDDTITISGQVWTFKTTLSGGSNEILIGVSAAATLDNAVAALNDPFNSASSSNYSAWSYESFAALPNVVATDGTTNMSVEIIGGGEVTFAASESADVWSSITVHNLLLNKGSITGAMLKYPFADFVKDQNQPGAQIFQTAMKFGAGVYGNDNDSLIDIQTTY